VLLLIAEITADLQSGCDGGSVVGVGKRLAYRLNTKQGR